MIGTIKLGLLDFKRLPGKRIKIIFKSLDMGHRAWYTWIVRVRQLKHTSRILPMHLAPVARGEARSVPKRKILTSQDGRMVIMDWFGLPNKIDKSDADNIGTDTAALKEKTASAADTVRAYFYPALYNAKTVAAAKKAAWVELRAAYNLVQYTGKVTADERAETTKYNAFYKPLQRECKALAAMTFRDKPLVPAVDKLDVFRNAEFDGKLNFATVKDNLRTLTASRNKLAQNRIDQLVESERVESRQSESARIEQLVQARLAELTGK